MIYIQRKEGSELETVDEFETLKEARAILKEYTISDYSAHYYTTRGACKDWTK